MDNFTGILVPTGRKWRPKSFFWCMGDSPWRWHSGGQGGKGNPCQYSRAANARLLATAKWAETAANAHPITDYPSSRAIFALRATAGSVFLILFMPSCSLQLLANHIPKIAQEGAANQSTRLKFSTAAAPVLRHRSCGVDRAGDPSMPALWHRRGKGVAAGRDRSGSHEVFLPAPLSWTGCPRCARLV